MSDQKIKTRFRIIHPDGAPKEMECWMQQVPSLKLLTDLIDPILGDHLERVCVLADYDGDENHAVTDMFVGEISALKGLLVNAVATEHYRRATMMGRTAADIPNHPDDLPAIFGVAILFERRVWF